MNFYNDVLDSDGKRMIETVISVNGYDEDYFLNCSLTHEKLKALDKSSRFILLSVEDEDEYEDKDVALLIYEDFKKVEFLKGANLEYSKENAKCMDSLRKLLYKIDSSKEYVYVRFLECFEEGNGYGKAIVNKLKESCKNIILYSTSDAESFWVKQGFTNIYDNIYKFEC